MFSSDIAFCQDLLPPPRKIRNDFLLRVGKPGGVNEVVLRLTIRNHLPKFYKEL